MRHCVLIGSLRDSGVVFYLLLIALLTIEPNNAQFLRGGNRKGAGPSVAQNPSKGNVGTSRRRMSPYTRYAATYQASNTVCQCLQFHKFTTCPSGFIRCNNKCLKFHSMQANWLDAKQYCEATRSKLISIESPVEQNCIMGYIIRHKDTFPGSFWTGGNNLQDQFRWRWVANNAPVGRYRYWQDGNPDDGGRGSEHCMELERNYYYRWNDQPCDMRNHFICQIPLNKMYSTPP